MASNQDDPNASNQGTEGELEERRARVLQLRLRRISQVAIARALGVDQGTISRDLKWIYQNWRERYGSGQGLDPAEEIGEALAVFLEAETQAFRQFNKLDPTAFRDRTTALKTAMLARQMRVHLLQDLGMIERQYGTVGFSFNADAVRFALREEGLLETRKSVIEMDAEEGEDEVMRWLKKEL